MLRRRKYQENVANNQDKGYQRGTVVTVEILANFGVAIFALVVEKIEGELWMVVMQIDAPRKSQRGVVRVRSAASPPQYHLKVKNVVKSQG